MDNDRKIVRNKRQMGGGSIMVWAALLPNGVIQIEQIKGRYDSAKYIEFLDQKVKPFLDENLCTNNYIFQQDNASIHVSKQTKEWLCNNFSSILEWPAKSPDLNPVENVWKMLSDLVYDGPEYKSQSDLWDAISRAAAKLMDEKSDILKKLTAEMPKRLLKVIKNKGNIIDY